MISEYDIIFWNHEDLIMTASAKHINLLVEHIAPSFKNITESYDLNDVAKKLSSYIRHLNIVDFNNEFHTGNLSVKEIKNLDTLNIVKLLNELSDDERYIIKKEVFHHLSTTLLKSKPEEFIQKSTILVDTFYLLGTKKRHIPTPDRYIVAANMIEAQIQYQQLAPEYKKFYWESVFTHLTKDLTKNSPEYKEYLILGNKLLENLPQSEHLEFLETYAKTEMMQNSINDLDIYQNIPKTTLDQLKNLDFNTLEIYKAYIYEKTKKPAITNNTLEMTI